MLRPETLVAVRKLKDSQDRYQLQPDPTVASGYSLLGHPVTVTGTTTITTSAVLADFSQVAVARDPSVTVLSETFANYDQQALRVVTRYDAAPLNPQTVVILRDITV